MLLGFMLAELPSSLGLIATVEISGFAGIVTVPEEKWCLKTLKMSGVETRPLYCNS